MNSHEIFFQPGFPADAYCRVYTEKIITGSTGKNVNENNEYLDKTSKGNVKFTVKEVIFYPEKDFYRCEFRVNMHGNTIDTIGSMAATISKDFNTVKRSR
jgi:hypothetical protein